MAERTTYAPMDGIMVSKLLISLTIMQKELEQQAASVTILGFDNVLSFGWLIISYSIIF